MRLNESEDCETREDHEGARQSRTWKQDSRRSSDVGERPANGRSVKIIKTTTCGADLHILKRDLPTCAPGRILGNEGVGVVHKVGAPVTAFHAGDRLIVSLISSCGKCDYCRRGMYSHCANGGWTFGSTIDGAQAEYVRIPFADTSFYHTPESFALIIHGQVELKRIEGA